MFSLSEINKALEDIMDDDTIRNWEFIIPHTDMINFEEITKYISRENPIGVIQFSDKSSILFIHKSLITKTHILGLQSPFSLIDSREFADESIIAIEVDEPLSVIIKWAKGVKSAEWEEKATFEKVRIIIPKI